MGYTHYWRYTPSHDRYAALWPRLVADAGRIIDRVRHVGVVIAGPDGRGRPILNPLVGIGFNGQAAHGLDGEPFRLLPPELRPGVAAGFCKTGRRPYDLAVAAVLLRCRLLLPEMFQLASDGGWEAEWRDGAMPGAAGAGSTLGARGLVGELFGAVPETSPLRPTGLPGPG